jgi:hypothetical protein
MRRLRRLPPLVLALLLVSAAVAAAGTVAVATGLLATASKTLTKATCTLSGASIDTYVNESNKTQTNGSTSSIVVENVSGSRRRAFVRFNFASCPNASNLANAGVDSATLTLNWTSATGTPRTIKVYRVTSDWTSLINWNTQPSFAASPTGTMSLTSIVPGSRSADVTADVNDFLQSSPTPLPPYASVVSNFGWALADEGTGTGLSTFSASEASTGKPTLTINYAF